jgi:hypothetical protein
MRINKHVVLTLMAIWGSILSYFIISLFIVPITVGKYIAIEVVISFLHYMYNKVKVQIFNY